MPDPLELPTRLATPHLDLGEAFRIAAQVHGDQRDKSGEPYLAHVLRVMSKMDTDIERVVAILHDTIEDIPEVDEQLKLTRHIYMTYGGTVADAVLLLTHVRWDLYSVYIERVARNTLARKIKIADCEDNCNPSRLAKLPPDDRIRLTRKYAYALNYLYSKESHETSTRNPAGAVPARVPFGTDHDLSPYAIPPITVPVDIRLAGPFAAANRIVESGPYPNRESAPQTGEPAIEVLPAPTAAAQPPE